MKVTLDDLAAYKQKVLSQKLLAMVIIVNVMVLISIFLCV